MDFHSLPRRQLQTLCKQYKIPANTTNVAMATALHNLLNNGGISEAVVAELLTPTKTEAPQTLATPGRMTRSQMKKHPNLDIEATDHPVLESSKKPPVSRKSTLGSSSTTEPKHREQKRLFDTSDGEFNSGISYQEPQESGKSLSARKPRSSRVSKSAVVEERATSEGQSEEVSSAAENVATQESFKISIKEHLEAVEDVSALTGVTNSDEVEEEAEVVVPAKDTEAAGDSAMAIDENLIEENDTDITESFESQRWKYTCSKALDAAGEEKFDVFGGGEESTDNALEHAIEELVASEGQDAVVPGLDTEVTVNEISVEDQVHDNVIADGPAAGEKEPDASGDEEKSIENALENASEEMSLQSVAAEGQDAFVDGQVPVTEFSIDDQVIADGPPAKQAVFDYPEPDQVDTEDSASMTEDAEGIQDEEQHIGDSVGNTEVYMIEADEQEEEVKMMVANEQPDTKLEEGFVHVGSGSVDEQASRMDDDQSEVKKVKICDSESAQHIGVDAVEQLSAALSEVKLSGKAEKQRKLELSAVDKENLPFGFERMSLRQLRKVYKTRVEKKVKQPKPEVTPLSPNVKKNNSAH